MVRKSKVIVSCFIACFVFLMLPCSVMAQPEEGDQQFEWKLEIEVPAADEADGGITPTAMDQAYFCLLYTSRCV